MRLTFSSINHMNTDISDERGYIYYTISTPSTSKKVTTITKYRWSDNTSGAPETMGVIEWHRRKQTVFRFDGKVVPADVMLAKRTWSTGRYFIGPDRQTYKWKLASHCWMKSAQSNLELVRFHQKNLGILKPAHPAYLDISDRVVPMLDHIILTFIYVETLRISQRDSSRAAPPGMPAIPAAGAGC